MADPRSQYRIVAELPVDFLWRYRQLDRWHQPRNSAKFRSLVADIAVRGVQEPLRLRYDAEKALVVNGNHRLAVAVRLGIRSLPVSLEPELSDWPHADARPLSAEDLGRLVTICQADSLL